MIDKAAEAGLKFFQKLNADGNFVPVERRRLDPGAGHDADRDPLGLSGAGAIATR